LYSEGDVMKLCIKQMDSKEFAVFLYLLPFFIITILALPLELFPVYLALDLSGKITYALIIALLPISGLVSIRASWNFYVRKKYIAAIRSSMPMTIVMFWLLSRFLSFDGSITIILISFLLYVGHRLTT